MCSFCRPQWRRVAKSVDVVVACFTFQYCCKQLLFRLPPLNCSSNEKNARGKKHNKKKTQGGTHVQLRRYKTWQVGIIGALGVCVQIASGLSGDEVCVVFRTAH